MSNRLDQEMIERKLVSTRSQARMLIKQGDVSCDGVVTLKPGQKVGPETQIEIKADQLYVSRGAYKLKAAIENFKIDFKGLKVADCGASTGGFTQVLLENGAEKVFALDVGHDQLAEPLKKHEKVENIEGVNLKHSYELSEKVDACVADLSFISLTLVIDTMKSFLKNNGFMVVLLKPQFEAGKARIGKNGLVDPRHHQQIKDEVLKALSEKGLKVIDTCDSPIQGKKGNTEYLVYLELN